jgi:hypothetical protein
MLILLTALVCSANTFAGEAANVPEKKIPRNALFDQLIGTWDVRYEIFDKNGKVRRDRGQVSYSWILDGKALQEIWSSASESTGSQAFGTTIDFYDLERQRWTAVWIYPAQGVMSIMTGGEVNGSIVLTGHNQSGALERWSTSVTSPDSIAVRADVSDDDGKTWRPMGVSYLEGHRK